MEGAEAEVPRKTISNKFILFFQRGMVFERIRAISRELFYLNLIQPGFGAAFI